MKKIISEILVIMFLTNFAFGQEGILTKYFSREGRQVSKEQSYYYEMMKENLNSKDTVVTFYSGSDKIRSLLVVDQYGVGNGIFNYYHENGKLKSSGVNRNGRPFGEVKSYYPNGKPQSAENFNQDDWTSVITAYYDSIGNQIIKAGNGYCSCYFNSYVWPDLLEKGNLINGKKDSVWTGYNPNGSVYFHEKYKKGDFVSGISYDSLGNAYEYKEIFTPASPSGGMSAFYTHVGKTLRYPAPARMLGVQGKVFVEFIVNKDGSLSDFKAIRGIGSGCDDEAIRSMSTSPNWIPGKSRGQISKQRMVLPITYKLG